MIPASVAAHPAGRVLTAWCRRLADHAPRRIWFADLFVRRLELLGLYLRPISLDPLDRLMLDALAMSPAPTPAHVSKRLGLSENAFRLIVSDLLARQLIRIDGSGGLSAADGALHATGPSEIHAPVLERRTFRVLADFNSYLPLHAEGMSTNLPGDARSALESLRACVAQSPAWKKQHGFPEDLKVILDLDSDSVPTIPNWKRVPIDQGERHTLVLIHSSHDRVLGFSVRLDGSITGQAPCLDLDIMTATETLGLAEPDAIAWKTAWHDWCQLVRGVNPSEIEACTIDRQEYRLRVKTPADLLEKLRFARPEAFSAEAWLLTGDSRCRSAGLLELS